MNLRKFPYLLSVFLLLSACGEDPAPVTLTADIETPLDILEKTAAEPVSLQRIDFSLESPARRGYLDLYNLVDGTATHIDRLPFSQTPFKSYVQYSTPISVADSYLLAHVSFYGDDNPSPREFLCFRHLSHHGNRHQIVLSCDQASTITFYIAATQIGRSNESPFSDISHRIISWSSLYEARSNDLIAFFISAFATLENALIDIGDHRFDPRHQSLRPIMETIASRSLDIYQRSGRLSSDQLVQIALAVTGNDLPLGRLNRFPDVFNQYAYVEDVQLHHTGGTLTSRPKQLELLTMQNELERFYVRDADLEMSDYRTHTVQSVSHSPSEGGIELSWDPLPHMYGYNLYLDKQHIGSTKDNRFLLQTANTGVVTIRAVGHAGEFDGYRHDLEAPLLAEVSK